MLHSMSRVALDLLAAIIWQFIAIARYGEGRLRLADSAVVLLGELDSSFGVVSGKRSG